MLDVLKRDSKASFFFVGAEDENDELGMATRRFRVYKKFTIGICRPGSYNTYHARWHHGRYEVSD